MNHNLNSGLIGGFSKSLLIISSYLLAVRGYFQNLYTSSQTQTHITDISLHYFRRVSWTKIFHLMGAWICTVGCFQVAPQNFLLFVTFKGILSKLSYVKPNQYNSLFCELGVLCYQSYINSRRWIVARDLKLMDLWQKTS